MKGFGKRSARKSDICRSVFPVPDLLEEMLHIDFLPLHFDHPGVLQHSPRGRAARSFLFQTEN